MRRSMPGMSAAEPTPPADATSATADVAQHADEPTAVRPTSRVDLLADFGRLLLRVGIGLAMLTHGLAKAGDFAGTTGKMDGLLGLPGNINAALAIFAEVGCSILLIVGLLTRLAAVPLAFTMGVALAVVHLNDAWEKQEKAALYLLVYVAIVLLGPGRFALDALLARVWAKRSKA